MNSEADQKQEITSDENFPGDLTVRLVEPKDRDNIRILFRKIFSEEMTEAHWHWKYEQGQGKAVVVYQGNKLLAHYGGVGTDILLEGLASTAMQIADLMVDPEARYAVRSRSPFYLSAKMFLESYIGYENPFLLGYGFPSDRAMGLSEKLDLFAPVGQMLEVEWKIKKRKPAFTERVILLTKENYAGYADKINALWQKFGEHFKQHIICRKDAGYFQWRFLEHPTKNYTLHLVENKFTGKPGSLLVLREDGDKVMLMDILSRSLDLEKVISQAESIISHQHQTAMVTWCSDAFSKTFSVRGAQLKPLPVIIPACTATSGPVVESQKNKWWFMPGDTDYL